MNVHSKIKIDPNLSQKYCNIIDDFAARFVPKSLILLFVETIVIKSVEYFLEKNFLTQYFVCNAQQYFS